MKRNSDGKYQAFYIEGIKVVDEILNSKKAIDILFIAYSKELLISSNGGETLLKKLESKKGKIELIEFSKNVFEQIVDTKTPQGVLAVLKIPSNTKNIEVTETLDYNASYIIIDKVQDAGNLGTIIRTAEAFDIKNIICLEGTTDAYSQKVIRSSMGSIVRENILYFDLENFEKIIKKLKENGYKIYATSLEKSDNLEEINITRKTIFVLGNEANGVSKEIKNLADKNVKIPMSNNTDSLNVGIASGILMYKQYIAKSSN